MTTAASVATKRLCPDFPTFFRDAKNDKLAESLKIAQAEQNRRVRNSKNISLDPLAQVLATFTDTDLASMVNSAKQETIRRNHPQAAEIETWMGSQTVLKINNLAALVLEYVASNDDLSHVKTVAGWYNDRPWLDALESAENSPSTLIKNHELAMRAVRLQAKVAADGHIRCDEVALQGIQFKNTSGYSETLPEFGRPSKPFYLASNRSKSEIWVNMCYHPLENELGETHFWLLQAGKTYSITINQRPQNWGSPLPDSNPLPTVFSIDASKLTLTVGSSGFACKSVLRCSNRLPEALIVLDDREGVTTILDPVVGRISDAVAQCWRKTNQPYYWDVS